MKATKFTLTVTVEVLSMDAAASLLMQAVDQISEEFHNGELTAADGDTVKWKTASKSVGI